METIKRNAAVLWKGDLETGNGDISTESQVLFEVPYTFGTRFGQDHGTNPEELIAAAHAACFSMAFAGELKKKGYTPERIETNGTCIMESLASGGFAIKKMHLQVRGKVENIDAETFEAISREADKGCPVSNLLRPGVVIEIEVTLLDSDHKDLV